MSENTNQVIEERRAKLNELRAQGNPFPNDFRRENLAGDLHAFHDAKSQEDLETVGLSVAVAGRMVLKRVMGKVSFATIQDMSGRIQLFIATDSAGPAVHEHFKKQFDLGDIVGARGWLFKTKAGELSVRVS